MPDVYEGLLASSRLVMPVYCTCTWIQCQDRDGVGVARHYTWILECHKGRVDGPSGNLSSDARVTEQGVIV